MGIAARGDFDLLQHSKHSGKMLDYLDESQSKKYIPHVIEPSFGLDRFLVTFRVILMMVYSFFLNSGLY
jgi:glycyl-tRNA synthetase